MEVLRVVALLMVSMVTGAQATKPGEHKNYTFDENNFASD
jgi:hypothetical protein